MKLARIVLVVLAVELALYLGLGGRAWQRGADPSTVLGTVAAVALGWRAGVVALFFGWAWAFRGQRPAEMTIGPLRTLGLVLSEYLSLLALYTMFHPFYPLLRRADAPEEANQPSQPVLLVHGFFCNEGYWWALRGALARRGLMNVYLISLEPPFGSLNRLAEQLAARVQDIVERTGSPKVILVGHSMGGLVSRAYAQRFGGAPHVARIITLGTPHRGTAHAYLSTGAHARQMRPNNPWIEELNAEPLKVPVTSIFSYHDDIIAPQDSGHFERGRNLPGAGVVDLAMTFSPLIQQLVYQELTGITVPMDTGAPGAVSEKRAASVGPEGVADA